MPRDTDAPTDRDTRATVRLRVERFDAFASALGYTTITGRAELIGVDRKTLQRVLAGEIVPGEAFIGKTVAALRRNRRALKVHGLTPSLDELFEVVEVAPAEAAVTA